MGNKLLIYIGEGLKFDAEPTIRAIESMSGASNARRGNFIGAVFQCEFEAYDRRTTVRLSPEFETITTEGLGDESLEFALQLQQRMSVDLRAIDMGYSFDVGLRDFASVPELRSAISD